MIRMWSYRVQRYLALRRVTCSRQTEPILGGAPSKNRLLFFFLVFDITLWAAQLLGCVGTNPKDDKEPLQKQSDSDQVAAQCYPGMPKENVVDQIEKGN